MTDDSETLTNDNSLGSAFAKGAKNVVRSAVRGAKVLTGTAEPPKAQSFGLAPGPGGDNSNFPGEGN